MERMCALLPSLLIAGALVGVALFASTAPAGAQSKSPRVVQLGLGKTSPAVKVPFGKSDVIRTDAAFTEIVVADPEIADVLPLTDRSVSVLGKKIGSTRLSVYGEGKQLVGVFDVEIAYDTSALASELATQFPYASFRVSSVNGRILLSGSAPDGVTLDRAVTIAKQFGPEVINSVRVTQPQQVLLEVRFVEATRSAGRELGVDWEAVGRRINVATGSFVSGATNMLSGSEPFGTVLGNLLMGGVQADVLIRGLEDRGVARRLAEPNLVALSGDTANFLAGGEFPIPVAQQQNAITIEFKKFGVGLAFTPTVLGDGIINLKIEPEVSQIDPTSSIRIGGLEIPGLSVRRANTTVELRDGQSFAIAGLLQNTNEVSQSQLPWIGNVPILGALFKSAAYQKRETDLVIIVTPRLVRPSRPGDLVRTPLDNTRPPNDVDFFVNGVSEITPKMARLMQTAETGVVAGRPNTGHVLELPLPILAAMEKLGRTEVGHVISK
jgi:pilus assembly protein CpaC